MKEPMIDRQRTVVAHGQASVIAQPLKGALLDPRRLYRRLALAACAVLYDAERSVRCRADFNFRRRCRVKVVSQTNTLAVDHHHPLRPLTPLGFSTAQPPFSLERKTAVHERFAPLQFLAFI